MKNNAIYKKDILMKKILAAIIILTMLFTSCAYNQDVQLENTAQVTATSLPTLAPTEVPTATPTLGPTATPVPDKPKYIFIVIGDGFGRGQMMMGEIYARIENQNMDDGAVWESFTQQSWVDGRGESASGGTAVATGLVVDPSVISQNNELQDLYTIMDRAKANGMSTGVVTNSFLMDATPATFLTHDDYRTNWDDLVDDVHTCNVDYIAGGGLMRFVPVSYYDSFDNLDCRYKNVQDMESASRDSSFPMMVEQLEYVPYLGMEGAQSFLEQVRAGTFSEEKAICIFSESTMAYESAQLDPDDVEKHLYVPSLPEMTLGGIQTLSQNPNGFVMMIEEASIDKRGHNGSQSGQIAQVRALNDTLGTIMDFYNEHPYETLIILTADHETGEYKFSEDKLEQFKTMPSFTYSSDANQIINFLDNEWDVEVYGSKITKYLNYTIESPWPTEHENFSPLYNYITLKTSEELGIEMTTEYHSWQLVPLYTLGTKSENFASATGIQDIPIIICDFMGWNALPEAIQN